MRTISIAVAVLINAAGIALAAPPGRYWDWAEGPVQHLMMQEEMSQWQGLQTEEQAKAFVALFWAKRDPTPATPRNEWREEFDKRVDLADEHFGTKRTRGAMTDRGRTLILLGSPYQVGNKGPARTAPANPNYTSVDQWDGQVRGPRGASAMLTWTYSHDKKPQFIKRKDFAIMFVDDQGDGQWQFGTTDRLNPEVILQEAVRAYLINPNLTIAPVVDAPRATSLRNPSLKNAYEQFRAENKSANGPALLTWGEFVTPDGEIFVPVQLFVPASAGIEAGRPLTFFGVVENSSGDVVEVHEQAVTLTTSRGDAYIDKSLRLEPGRYTATFGLAADGKPLALATAEMVVERLNPRESAISPLILSNNIYPLPEFPGPTDPFAFGGLKVVPKGDSTFSPKDDLWYFLELRNPGLSEKGDPKVQVKIDIEGKTDTRKVRMPFPLQDAEIAKLKGVENRYAVGTAIPLATFPPGDYTIKIRVIDSVLDKKYDFERKFQVRTAG